MIFGWPLAFLPLAAIYFGREALKQIKRAPEEYSGQGLAKIGIGLGAGLGISLSVFLIFLNSEVPHGYQVLEWADLEPDPNKPSERIPESAYQYEKTGDSGQKIKVYVRGYIIPGRQQVRLKEFSICRTSDQCRFAIKANRPTDLIHIELTGDRTIDYTTHEIGVGGVFHVDKDSATPYGIQADYLYP